MTRGLKLGRSSCQPAWPNKSADVRVTVETSVIWGVVGLAIIALVVAGLVYVFQRYGRR